MLLRNMLAVIRCSVGCRRNGLYLARPANQVGIREKSESSFKVDRSKVPELKESDLEEHFIHGSGPGGQCVNKSYNCCQLRHLPSGILVKVHESRSLDKNRKIARAMIISKLDNMINGEDSVQAQQKRHALQKMATREASNARKRELKQQFKALKESDST